MNLKSRHVVAAIALHLLLFGLLLAGAQCTRKVEPVSIIQGTLISASQLPKEQSEPVPQPAAEPPSPEPVPASPPPSPKADPADAQRAEEQQRQKEQAETKAREDAKQVLQKQQAEAQAQVQAQAEKAAELKKQADAEDKKRAADEARKKADADEQKRKDDLIKAAAAEDAKRAADEKKKKDLQARLDAEAKRLREAELSEALGAETAERQKQDVSVWGTQLTAALQRVWSRPPGLDQNLKCVINMQLSATGEVLSAKISSSSGNALYDESVVRAAYKASPLPLPANPAVFQSGINITFVPKS